MARRRIRRFGTGRPLGADIAPAFDDVVFAPPLLGVLKAGDDDELRMDAPPALVVVGVVLVLVVVGVAFVVDVDDDVLAREVFADESIDVAEPGDEPEFNPRVFSFQVSLPPSDLFDENSVER